MVKTCILIFSIPKKGFFSEIKKFFELDKKFLKNYRTTKGKSDDF